MRLGSERHATRVHYQVEHPAKSTTLHSQSKALQSLLGGKDAHFVCQQEDPSKQENRAHFHLPAPQKVLTIRVQSRYFNLSPYHQHHQSTNSHSPNTSRHETQLAFLALLFSATIVLVIFTLLLSTTCQYSSLQFFLPLLLLLLALVVSLEHHLIGSPPPFPVPPEDCICRMKPPVAHLSRYSFLSSLSHAPLDLLELSTQFALCTGSGTHSHH